MQKACTSTSSILAEIQTNINARDSDGKTPLQIALEMRWDDEIIVQLISFGTQIGTDEVRTHINATNLV